MEPATAPASSVASHDLTLAAALEALTRERARHEAVATLGLRSLRGTLDRDELIAEALDLLVRLLPCDVAALVDVSGDDVVVVAATDPDGVGHRSPRAGSLVDLAVRTGAPVLSNDLAGDPRLDVDDRLAAEQLLAGSAVPMTAEAGVQAISCLTSRGWTDPNHGLTFLQQVANVLVAEADRRAAEGVARAEQERFRRLAENVPDAIFHLRIRPERRIEYLSPRFTELSGLSLAELEADPDAWRRVVPEDDVAVFGDVFDLQGDDVVSTRPYRLVGPDGGTRWVETRVAPVRDADGTLTAVFGATRDVTTLQETEEALRRALERERMATEEFRQVGELKNALLAAVSHELRTPLTAVVGFAELLQNHEHEFSAERRQELLSSLGRNARRLEQLLGDLLDLDRLDRSVVEPVRRPTAVSDLVARVVQRLDASDRTLAFDLPPVHASIDAPKVERIVENLLVNAVKHTHPGSSIWVSIAPSLDGLTIVVEDDGPGVPDELKPVVFDAFVRGDSDHRSHAPGTGIGLSLVARFAELHGGRAWVEDRPGGGASFRVSLPDGPPEAGEGDLARRAAPAP